MCKLGARHWFNLVANKHLVWYLSGEGLRGRSIIHRVSDGAPLALKNFSVEKGVRRDKGKREKNVGIGEVREMNS